MERIFQLHLGRPLTVEVVQDILAQQITLTYSPDSKENLNPESFLPKDVITPAELQKLAIGLGLETPAELTPIMLLLLAYFFAKNPVANNSQIISRILEFYRFEVFPQVFRQGLYASPTAHLLLPVFGATKVYYQGYLLKAADVHDIFSWQFLPWPDELPRALTETSFLGVSNVLYCFIQFKNIVIYSQELLPAAAIGSGPGNLFQDQIDNLVTQLNDYLAFPVGHLKHVNGLVYQVVKLISKFGEHTFENITQLLNENKFSFSLNNQISLNSHHLLALLEALNQENLLLFESNFNPNSETAADLNNPLMMQPYFFLKNLEKILAIVTLLQLTAATNPENLLIGIANLRDTYRKQVVDVLQEANFDELIRKTIAFMYARVASK